MSVGVTNLRPIECSDSWKSLGGLGSIALSSPERFGALAQMDATDEEKANACRAQRLIYVLMVVMIGAPIVIYLLRIL